MKIGLLSYGTRGDVQPFIGLAHALRARGHDVVVGAPENHVAFVRSSGLTVHPLAGDSDALFASEQGKRWVLEGSFTRLMQALVAQFRALSERVEKDARAVSADADVLVGGALASGVTRLHAEERGIPWTVAHTFPGRPTRAFPSAMVSLPFGLPGVVNRQLSSWMLRLVWLALHDIDDGMRDRRGLVRAAHEPTTALFSSGRASLHLWSPALVPPPSDWPAHEHVTGFCALPTSARAGLGETRALGDVEEFLAAGPPPVYLGLGSMPVLDAHKTLALFTDVVRALGVRALVGGNFVGVDVNALLPSTMRAVGPVDHDALFPRCAGVLHHGGAGSTHTSLRAGRPTFVCTVLGDQPFWGRVVARHGAGAWTPFRSLTAEKLKRGLATLFEPRVVERARALGAQMKAEPDGAAAAAARLEAIFAR
jgi:sterol 3beta-glucosyltransferase